MPEAPEPAGFEKTPQIPESSVESPGAGGSFEAPAAPVERPKAPAAALAPVSAPASATAPGKDPVLRQVEHVLEEGLDESYRKMPPRLRQKFSKEGDRAAATIFEMVRKAKVKAGSVLAIITRWLRIIPGINAFFLIQEAKIKTDKIIALAREESKRNILP